MGSTPNNGEFQDGIAEIKPVVIYGPNGQPISSTNPLSITVANANANGQNTMNNSSPVVIASDQTPVPVKGSTVGSAAPAQAFYLGIKDFSNNLQGVFSVGAIGYDSVDPQTNLPIGLYGYVGSNLMSLLRTPNIFKTATATGSGNTAVWTPTSGKKFRLMRFRVDLPANAAISGGGVIVDITFQDASTDLGIGISVFVPTTAVTTTMGGFTTGWVDLGNGKLSAAANNVLNINLSATLTTGKTRVSVAGVEE